MAENLSNIYHPVDLIMDSSDYKNDKTMSFKHHYIISPTLCDLTTIYAYLCMYIQNIFRRKRYNCVGNTWMSNTNSKGTPCSVIVIWVNW